MKQTAAIIGAQWGDEGKGKVVDWFARRADWVVRYQGGNNAGHTVVVDDDKYVLHLIPSGILHENALSLVGPGLVVNLRELMDEIEMLKKAGKTVLPRLRLAARAHVLFPFHQYIDSINEAERGEDKIGTTGKGIGPAYIDKIRRTGLRICDLAERDLIETHCEQILDELGTGWHEFEASSAGDLADEYYEYYKQLEDLIIDSPAELDAAYRRGEKILFEGAQGSLLDIDFGTYPYVTSSNPTVGGVVTGSGFPGHRLQTVLGIAKAYTTRVGEGPFPSELTGEIGGWFQDKGGEFGATTGRPRRCGWLDLKILRYTARVNGFTDIALTKLDVLSGKKNIKVAIDYCDETGRPINGFPARSGALDAVQPVYEELPGWDEDISDCRAFNELPQNARDYVNYIEENLEVPISYISVGPGREEFIERG